MSENHIKLLAQVQRYAEEYIKSIDQMPAFPEEKSIEGLEVFEEPLPNCSSDPSQVIQLLHEVGSKATTAQTGGRYFGFVNGGLLPVSHGAQWLVDTWNQNTALYLMSPVSAKLEEICEQWLVELLGLEKGTAAGLVTGSSNAIICALAAGRNHIYRKKGYDIVENGLRGAPSIRVVVNEQVHATVWSALSLLGFGKQEITAVPADEKGRLKLSELPALTSDTLLVIQAGNVNGGAFDPINEICDLAREADAWVHIDGAFGLWAASSKKHCHLTAGLEKADSYSMDAHKTLNASYDCGVVLCRHREALVSALNDPGAGAYIHYSDNRDNMRYTTEMSRRPRAVALWAAMKQLGRKGIEELIDTLCNRAEYFASELEKAGFIIVNPASFNQFICKCETPEKTKRVLEQVQASGICWCGGSVWDGEPVIRVSVCSHATTVEDIDRSVGVFRVARSKFL